MKNSFKQLIRTPVKTALFFLLILLSTALLTFGALLLTHTKAQIDQAKAAFTTLATVSQKPNAVETVSIWDAALQTYTNYSIPQYDSVIDVGVLDIEGAPYVGGPEKRPYYGALLEDMQNTSTYKYLDFWLICEFRPQEDCLADHPVRVDIVRMLGGDPHGSTSFTFCDHHNDNPVPLEKDKTYFGALMYITGHDMDIGSIVEFVPYGGWEEAAPERFPYWENLVKSLRQLDNTIPVLPAQSLQLLAAYHENQFTVIDGREISPEEFAGGSAVCMVTHEFARVNGLQVGDTLKLPLYFADYRDPASEIFGYGGGAITGTLLDEEDKPFEPFFEGRYEIVGIYRYTEEGKQAMPGTSEMARDMVIVPAASVTASDEKNIFASGPMLGTTTSFQLENGTIAQFEEALRQIPESRFLQVDYDDNGYEQVAGSLNRVQEAAVLLCGAGGFCAAAVVALLLYFFIVKQKRRTAIERSLGMSKRQCRVSLLSGLFALTVCACALGGLGSRVFFDRVQIGGVEASMDFSTKYSTWASEDSAEKIEPDTEDSKAVSVVVPLGLTAFTLLAGLALVERNLRVEPVGLLGA